MTRQEFDSISSYDELFDACYEYGCEYILDNLMDEEYCDRDIEEMIPEYLRHDSWRGLRDYLYSIPEGYEYYIRTDDGEYIGTDSGDDSFCDYKHDVLMEILSRDGFDEDEEEEEHEPESHSDIHYGTAQGDSIEQMEFCPDITLEEFFNQCKNIVFDRQVP